jgi:hypothetical protein
MGLQESTLSTQALTVIQSSGSVGARAISRIKDLIDSLDSPPIFLPRDLCFLLALLILPLLPSFMPLYRHMPNHTERHAALKVRFSSHFRIDILTH